MLASVQIARRQSEIRQSLSALVGKATPTEDETRSMEAMDAEYRANETRYRAALIAEDAERREAGADLETRSDRQFADLIAGFEMRQVVLSLDEGRALSGKTAEVVQELRHAGGYRGVPVPLMALVGVISVFTWRRTGSHLPGALICALLLAWYVSAGTATHWSPNFQLPMPG